MDRPWERHGDVFNSEASSRSWREKAERVIEMYVDRTNGSSLEFRKSAVLFRYGKSDFEFGALQAAELKEHLEGVFQGWPLDVIQGKDYIEVRPEGVGKGKVIEHILDRMRSDGNPADFVLCVGDDVADELMFEKLNEMVASAELPRGGFSMLTSHFAKDCSTDANAVHAVCRQSVHVHRWAETVES